MSRGAERAARWWRRGWWVEGLIGTLILLDLLLLGLALWTRGTWHPELLVGIALAELVSIDRNWL